MKATRIIIKIMAISGVLMSLFAIAADGMSDPFTFAVAGLVFILAAFTLVVADDVL